MDTRIIVSNPGDLHDCGELANSVIVGREIRIFGRAIHFRIAAANAYARLSDIVPAVRTVCDQLLDAMPDLRAENGKRRVSCRKGCAACCSYLVPLSLPEVFRMREEFAAMPADDRIPILKSAVHAAFRILRQDITEPEINGDSDLQQISRWYACLNIPCPFLSDGICGIYEQRPLACREYFVTSRPKSCETGGSDHPHVVRLPLHLAEILGDFAARLEPSETEAVMLPLALIGTDELIERSGKRWPAVEMVNLFFDLLEQAAAQHTEPLAVPS